MHIQFDSILTIFLIMEPDDGELLESAPAAAEVPVASKSESSKTIKPAAKKSNGARPIDRSNGGVPEASNGE